MNLEEIVERSPMLVKCFEGAAGGSDDVDSRLVRDQTPELPFRIALQPVENDVDVVDEQKNTAPQPVGFPDQKVPRLTGSGGRGGKALNPLVQNL